MLGELSGWLHQSFNDLVVWIELYPGRAYFLVFLTACLESLVVVGLFLPGTVLMFAIGALIATDALAFWPACLWAAAGAVTGDGLSFWLGRHFHQRMRVIWPFRRYPGLINHGVDFFHRHGGKSVVFARFVGPVRPFLPAVAGMLDMPTGRFLLVNVLSALVWAPAYLIPGVVFGASLSLAAEVAGRLVVLILLIVGLVWFSLWLIHRLFNLLQPHLASWTDRAQAWGRRHPRLRPLAGALLEPEHPEARGLAAWLALLFLSAAALGLLLAQPLIGIDHWLHVGLQDLRTPTADRIFVAITTTGDSLPVLTGLVLVLAWLAWRGYGRAAVHWLFAVASAWAMAQGLKLLLQVARPLPMYDGVAAYAFPSVHVTLASVGYGFLAVLIARELAPERRWLPYSLASLPIVLMAFSRLYLGAHWLSDIAGGLALGLATVALFGIAYRRHPAPALPWRRLLGVFLVLQLALAAGHTGMQFERALARYTPLQEKTPLNRNAWLAGDWRGLPAYRLDLTAGEQHPLNVQYLGTLEALEATLTARGWRSPPPPAFDKLLLWLSPDATASRLPVLPQIHDGHYESLRLIKAVADDRLTVLRLWRSERIQHSTRTPLWIGSVSVLEPARRFAYLVYLDTRYDPAAGLELLADLQDGFQVEVHPRPTGRTMAPVKVMLVFDGEGVRREE